MSVCLCVCKSCRKTLQKREKSAIHATLIGAVLPTRAGKRAATDRDAARSVNFVNNIRNDDKTQATESFRVVRLARIETEMTVRQYKAGSVLTIDGHVDEDPDDRHGRGGISDLHQHQRPGGRGRRNYSMDDDPLTPDTGPNGGGGSNYYDSNNRSRNDNIRGGDDDDDDGDDEEEDHRIGMDYDQQEQEQGSQNDDEKGVRRRKQ